MSKKLSEMSLKELFHLFPISLINHKDEWKEQFNEEKIFVENALSPLFNVKISHIGSTAIDGICAKNIVDMLVEVPKGCDLKGACDTLVRSGYICMSVSPARISLNKGYTPDGFADKVFHLHLRYEGDNDEIYFARYLNEHPSDALKYQQLKQSLARRYKYDRDAYTQAKTDFVKEITAKALALYK